jgi:gamma-glutamylputrescine oxidase
MRACSAKKRRARRSHRRFHGGLLDGLGGHFHPLNYALGLADAARRNGVTLFENSRAVSIDTSNGVVVRTGAGNVRARFGVLACDALLDGLEPRIAGRIMPVANYLVATEPLLRTCVTHR